MKVIFHHRFYEVYTADPAAARGRMESMVAALEGTDAFIEPQPAPEPDLARVHGAAHLQRIQANPPVDAVGRLAAGGAILAAELACAGQPAFGLIRPPGHHASPDSCWGFCYFNNVAIAIKKLIADAKIASALVLDFDLHYGDGTAAVFGDAREALYCHPEAGNRSAFLEAVERALQSKFPYEIIAVSAGFDRHEDDWGGLLATEDYFTLGKRVKEQSRLRCQGRRFGVLEGGYNPAVLGRNVRSFLEGLSD